MATQSPSRVAGLRRASLMGAVIGGATALSVACAHTSAPQATAVSTPPIATTTTVTEPPITTTTTAPPSTTSSAPNSATTEPPSSATPAASSTTPFGVDCTGTGPATEHAWILLGEGHGKATYFQLCHKTAPWTDSQWADDENEVPEGMTPPPDIKRSTVAPVLGKVYAPGQQGYGQVQPTTIFNGGDPTGRITNIKWSSWGAAQATGTGIADYQAPGQGTADTKPEQATVVAFNLGKCGSTLMYQSVTWFFPQHGQTFKSASSHANNTCTY